MSRRLLVKWQEGSGTLQLGYITLLKGSGFDWVGFFWTIFYHLETMGEKTLEKSKYPSKNTVS